MIRIGQESVDLVVQVEEFTSIMKVLDNLTLDTHNVLLLCPELFFTRFVQFLYQNNSFKTLKYLDDIEVSLSNNKSFISFKIQFKGKEFSFSIIILKSEYKTVYNPIKGEELYKVGFNLINI